MVFAGQGAQYSGMGRDLYDNCPEAAEVFDRAGEEVKHYSFEGTHEELRQTQITQPCVYTTSMAIWRAFQKAFREETEGKITVDCMAGFSLGEYAALTAAGAIGSLEEGLEIVRKRGEYMMDAGSDGEGNPTGGMAAAFGRREKILELVDDVRGGHVLEAVNFNSPVQTAIAGDRAILPALVEEGRARKIKVKLLSTGAAFHSSMMEPAAGKIQSLIADKGVKMPETKVYSNVTGRDMREAGMSIDELMGLQAKSPVYWQEIIEDMAGSGLRAIVEIGPGKTLTGFTKKTAADIPAMHVEDTETLRVAIDALKEL